MYLLKCVSTVKDRALDNVSQDLSYSVRTMRKNRVFVGTAVLTLALAIGGNTAIFAIVHAVLLKPLEYRDSDELVRISGGATPTRLAEMQTGARSFAEIGAYTMRENVTLSNIGEPEVLKSVHISANFLKILGVVPIVGRGFLPEEDSNNGPPVVMISAELWQRRFGRDSDVVGRTATLDEAAYTIIGVLPPRFQFPFPGVDLWMTAPSHLQTIPPKPRALSPFLTVFGRLRPGIGLKKANAEMMVIRRQYAMAHPAMLDAKPKTPIEITRLHDVLVADVRSILWMLFGAVGFVLAIACANLASLLLTRGAVREREFAIRSALGAARHRLIRQLLAESVLLSILGGAIGIVLASLCLRIIPAITAFDLPRVNEIHMDGLVLGFALALSVGTGLAFGLAPSLGLSRPDLIQVLRSTGVAANGRLSPGIWPLFNLRNVLSVGQVGLSLVLLVGAALLIESIAHLRNVAVGFNPDHLFTVNASLSPLRYDTDRKRSFFFREAISRIQTLPGVRSAAAAMTIPMMEYPGIPVQDAAKPSQRLNERLIAKYFPVTPGYFQTLGIAVKRGRDFSEHDGQDNKRVAIIDENLARRLWPAYPAGLDPIGQHLLVGAANPNPAEIIGVVSDVNQNLDSREDWQESVYVSFAQSPMPSAMLVVCTSTDPLSFTSAIRQQIRFIDRNQAIGEPQTMDDRMEAQVGQRRLLVKLLCSFALVAVLLALIGIYGVTAYSATQRAQEIGIRRALGAQQSDILWLVLSQGIGLAFAGIVVGLGGALALTRFMGKLIFHVSATDPGTFIGIALLFLFVALGATYIPARRATRVDPMAVLRV